MFEYTDKGSYTLSIGFTGFQRIDAKFDWNIIKQFDTDVLLIRDPKMAWYLCGIDGISKNVKETTEFINKYTSNYDKIYMFGSSMGGYASLLYGSLITHKIKIINAFAPQTNIKPDTLNLSPWTMDMVKDKVHPYINDHDKQFLSLEGIETPKTTYIHYGKHGKIDAYHANLIDCKKISYDCNSHAIALWMHKNSLLVPYLKDIYR
jgi:hypothetical protein